MRNIFLAIGTNLGDREINLKEALTKIEDFIGQVPKTSSVYETEPWGFKTKDNFLNMVVEVETSLSPLILLENVQIIESLMGRVRGRKRYASRTIDIDILFYEDLKEEDENLIIPHPLLHRRKFVLVPLCEIVPELIHPVLKKTVTELLKICEDTSEVKIYSGPPIP
jgi:2-amino-4-hydroxy-6-hydroxymethyldihydropteridine diphosphokinase